MSVHTLKTQNFRNLQNLQIQFCPQLNMIVGDNAQGKTNWLEAIYFAATGKSFRSQETNTLIAHGKEAAHLNLQFRHEGLESELEIFLKPNSKNLLWQGKPLRSWQKIHTLLRVLVFTPDSTLLFRSSPAQRRRYFDQAMSFQFPQYAKLLGRYQRVLRQRNLLLEEGAAPTLLAPFDQQWAALSAQIFKMRHDYLAELWIDWQARLKTLSNFGENFSAAWQGKLDYARHWQAEELEAQIKELIFLERRYRRTLLGPHLDGVQAFLSGKALREVASQGQQRLVIIALKLAEADFFHRHHHLAPVFLLDDIGSELDATHLENLLQTLSQLGAQTFLTTTHALDFSFLEIKRFKIERGGILEG